MTQTQKDKILINQTRWFQLCTALLLVIGSMGLYDYMQEKETNKLQQIQISVNKENIAVSKSNQRTTDNRLNKIESVVFIK